GPLGGNDRGVCHLRRRIRGAAGRRRDLRPLRRPHRPQVDADRDAAGHGPGDVRRGAGADLREHRRLGRRRFSQGVGVGGEWGGSVLMSMEWARSNRSRGFIASWPQFGVPCGLFLANLAVLAFSQMSGDSFLAWGWRVPFMLSIVLVGVGLYIRL